MIPRLRTPPGNCSVADRARRKAYWNIVLPLFLTSIIAYLDRINLSYNSGWAFLALSLTSAGLLILTLPRSQA